MKKLTQFTKTNLNIVRNKLEKALKEVENEMGITIKIGGMSYSDTNFTTKLSVILENAETKEELDFKEYSKLFYEVSPTNLHKKFDYQGKVYTLNGLSTRSRKYPFLALEELTGKTVKKSCFRYFYFTNEKKVKEDDFLSYL